ncbi:rod shape-determining protein [Candidatus Microgenomates bacterium]|nr:rod shape-determining protein [Candidatus Microgenomates bacterium]
MLASLLKKTKGVLGNFSSFLASDLAIDLGTANIKILVLGKGIQVKEPSCVARNKKSKKIVALGGEAKEMLGKTPRQLEAFRPLKNGVIADFDATEAILKFYLDKVKIPTSKSSLRQVLARLGKPRVIIGIPSGVTEVERMAVKEVALEAGAREAFLIEQVLASAVGAKLPVLTSQGTMMVDIGGGTTEVAVISIGGIVVGRSIRSAGDEMDEAIRHFCRLKYSLLLGIQSAEKVKIAIGSAFSSAKERHTVVRGRDLETGLPRSVRLAEGEIREAIAPVILNIIQAIKEVVEETPPELIGDVMEGAITLAGGGSLLSGLPQRIAQETKIPTILAEHPETSVVRGAAKILETKELFEKAVVG